MIKAGKTPEAWKANPHKLRQKDIDARWVKKNNISYYGYKNHIKLDQGTKLITTDAVTDAADHDSSALETLLEMSDGGQILYGDSAYVGQEEIIDECHMTSKIHEKGYRNKPLTDEHQHRF